MPTVERWRFMFGEVSVEWARWVEVWNQDVAGQDHPRDPIAPVRVLPAVDVGRVKAGSPAATCSRLSPSRAVRRHASSLLASWPKKSVATRHEKV